MRVYLGGPIDERQSDESWKGLVEEWLRQNGHEAWDPEVYGLAAVRRGLPFETIWEVVNEGRQACDFAIYRYSPYSVGTHMEIDRSRQENQEFFVWDLSPEEAERRVALWGVAPRSKLTLHSLLRCYVIPFLDREVVSQAETMAAMWAMISTYPSVSLSQPGPTDTYLTL